MEACWVDSYKAGYDRTLQLVGHNCELVTVAIKYLDKRIKMKDRTTYEGMFRATIIIIKAFHRQSFLILKSHLLRISLI